MDLKRNLKTMIGVLTAVLMLTTSFGFAAGDVNPGPSGEVGMPQVTVKALSQTSVKVSWKAVKGAKGYVIYKSRTGEDYRRVKTLYGVLKTSFVDKNCRKNTSYRYQVFAFKYENGQRVYGESDWVSEVAGVQRPKVVVWPAGEGKIDITVNCKTEDEKVELYRSTAKDGKYKKIIAKKANGQLSYLDKNLKADKTYYYKAKSARTLGGKTYTSTWSSTASARASNISVSIAVEDLNQPGQKTDTFVYKLTMAEKSAPVTILFEENQGGFIWSGQKETESSHWTGSTVLYLYSYSADGKRFVKMTEDYLVEPGETVYLKFLSRDKVMYYEDCGLGLSVSFAGLPMIEGHLHLNGDGTGRYTDDYDI